jgi:aminoglycoside 6'-N-acetyltransferase I
MDINKAAVYHLEQIMKLARKLWPEYTENKLGKAYYQILEDENSAIFLAEENRVFVGFAQCTLRNDYVQGTESGTINYLEGIYLEPEHCGQSVATELLEHCEKFAKEHGCTKFTSDNENTLKQKHSILSQYQALYYPNSSMIFSLL